MKISLHYFVYAGLIILIFYLALQQKPVVEPKMDYQKILDKNDSLVKVNASLEQARTIDKQEAAQLKHSLDSISSIRPKNIKHINNEVKRLHNSSTAGKLTIIDSILLARKGQR